MLADETMKRVTIAAVVLVANVTCGWLNLPPESGPTIDVQPKDQHLAVGSNLSLACTITNPAEDNSSQLLFFSFINDNDPDARQIRVTESALTVIDDRTINLTLHNVNTSHSGYYSCYLDDNGTESLFFGVTTVIVLDPPEPVTSINCTSHNFEDMTCTWCDDSLTTHTNYQFLYRIGGNANFSNCTHPIGPCGCYFCGLRNDHGCEPGGVDQHTFYKHMDYSFKITAYNKVKRLEPFHDSVHAGYPRVYLDAVETLNVTQHNSSALLLSWSVPPKMTYYNDQIQYHVMWSSQFEQNFPYAQVNVTATTRYMLVNLQPYTEYTVRIRARMGSSIYWSPVTTQTATTNAASPCAGPALLDGAYRVTSCVNKQCSIQFFYQGYNASCANGVVHHYVMYASRDGHVLASIKTADDEYSGALAELNGSLDYEVCLKAFTGEPGGAASLESPTTCITVPRQAQRPQQLTKLYAEQVENGSTINIHYEEVNSSITLLACQPQQSDSLQCQNSPDKYTFSGAHSPYRLENPTTDDGYMLYVTDNGVSSGMTSSVVFPCLEGTTPVYDNLGLKLDATADSITAEWMRPGCNREGQHAHITKFTLRLEQKGERVGEPISVDGWTTQYTFKHLKPATKYEVIISAQSRGGSGESIDESTTTDEKGTGVIISTAWIIGVCIILLFIIAITITGAIVFYRRDKRRGHGDVKQQIQLPPDDIEPITESEEQAIPFLDDGGYGTISTRADSSSSTSGHSVESSESDEIAPATGSSDQQLLDVNTNPDPVEDIINNSDNGELGDNSIAQQEDSDTVCNNSSSSGQVQPESTTDAYGNKCVVTQTEQRYDLEPESGENHDQDFANSISGESHPGLPLQGSTVSNSDSAPDFAPDLGDVILNNVASPLEALGNKTNDQQTVSLSFSSDNHSQTQPHVHSGDVVINMNTAEPISDGEHINSGSNRENSGGTPSLSDYNRVAPASGYSTHNDSSSGYAPALERIELDNQVPANLGDAWETVTNSSGSPDTNISSYAQADPDSAISPYAKGHPDSAISPYAKGHPDSAISPYATGHPDSANEEAVLFDINPDIAMQLDLAIC